MNVVTFDRKKSVSLQGRPDYKIAILQLLALGVILLSVTCAGHSFCFGLWYLGCFVFQIPCSVDLWDIFQNPSLLLALIFLTGALLSAWATYVDQLD